MGNLSLGNKSKLFTTRGRMNDTRITSVSSILLLCICTCVVATGDLQVASASPHLELSFEGDCSCNINGSPCHIELLVPDHQVITEISVSTIIQHSFRSDVNLNITSPGGLTVMLLNRNDGRDQNWNVIFSDSGGSLVDQDSDPLDSAFNRTVLPHQPLSVFHGTDAIGTWIISVEDCALQDDGVLREIELKVEGQVTSNNAFLVCPQDITIACGHSILPQDLPLHQQARLANCPLGSVVYTDTGYNSCPNQISRVYKASRAPCDPLPCTQRIFIANPPSFLNVTQMQLVELSLVFAEPLFAALQAEITGFFHTLLNSSDVSMIDTSSGPSLYLKIPGGTDSQYALEAMEASHRVSYSDSLPSIKALSTSEYVPGRPNVNVAAAVVIPLLLVCLIITVVLRCCKKRRLSASSHHQSASFQSDSYNAYQRDQEISLELFDASSQSLDR